MVTQIDIAKRVGLDVSSVNKILNQVPGPVFRKDTIARVNRAARELGYQRREGKHDVRRQLIEVEQALADLYRARSQPENLSQQSLEKIQELVLRGMRRMEGTRAKATG